MALAEMRPGWNTRILASYELLARTGMFFWARRRQAQGKVDLSE
jgi:hypothetical protein